MVVRALADAADSLEEGKSNLALLPPAAAEGVSHWMAFGRPEQ